MGNDVEEERGGCRIMDRALTGLALKPLQRDLLSPWRLPSPGCQR